MEVVTADGYVIGVIDTHENTHPSIFNLFPKIISIRRTIVGERYKRMIIIEKWNRGLQKEIYDFDFVDYNLNFPDSLLKEILSD